LYSAENMARLGDVRWISRVPETTKLAQQAVMGAEGAAWQPEGEVSWAPVAQTPQGERWVIVRTTQGEERARATLARKGRQPRTKWEKPRWHRPARLFPCEPNAQKSLDQQRRQCPEWLQIHPQLLAHPTHNRPGRPRKDAAPDTHSWQVEATVTLDTA